MIERVSPGTTFEGASSFNVFNPTGQFGAGNAKMQDKVHGIIYSGGPDQLLPVCIYLGHISKGTDVTAVETAIAALSP